MLLHLQREMERVHEATWPVQRLNIDNGSWDALRVIPGVQRSCSRR
jgi:hypothetical protein